MKKFAVIYITLLFAGFTQVSFAQVKANKIQKTQDVINVSTDVVNGNAHIPDGSLQTISNKDINAQEAPSITTNNILTSAINASGAIIERLTGLQFKYALMLNVNVESLKNLSLFGFIDKWFGTRYKMGGTTKNGIDCSALTSNLLLAVYGLALPRTAIQQYYTTTHIPKKELKEGDLVFFNTRGGVSHVGLYLANNYFVHASSSQGVTISSLDESYYSRRFICGGRISED